jgi:hypothetical protein
MMSDVYMGSFVRSLHFSEYDEFTQTKYLKLKLGEFVTVDIY